MWSCVELGEGDWVLGAPRLTQESGCEGDVMTHDADVLKLWRFDQPFLCYAMFCSRNVKLVKKRARFNSVLWMYAVCWLRKVTLTQFSKRIFWIAYIHGTELVWPRKVTLRESMCSVYTVYCTVGFICADFMFLLYIAQSRQSARLFLQSSELGPPPPSTAG
jgi:hypothetical protein